jgi:hypothetical protein
MEMPKKGPLFSMFITLLCASLKFFSLFFFVFFFQVNGIAGFGGFEFVGLALVGKDIVF